LYQVLGRGIAVKRPMYGDLPDFIGSLEPFRHLEEFVPLPLYFAPPLLTLQPHFSDRPLKRRYV